MKAIFELPATHVRLFVHCIGICMLALKQYSDWIYVREYQDTRQGVLPYVLKYDYETELTEDRAHWGSAATDDGVDTRKCVAVWCACAYQ